MSNKVGQNGVLLIENTDSISVRDSVIGNNVGEISSVVTARYASAVFDSVIIRDNYAADQTVQALGSVLKFSKTTFDGNVGPQVSNGFLTFESDVEISQSTIQNSLSETAQSGFFSLKLMSSL